MMTDHGDSVDNLTPSFEIARDRVIIEQNLKELMALCSSNPAEAKKLASDSLASARKLKDPALIGTSLCILSRAVSLLRGSIKSVELAARAIEILRPLDDKKSLATALNNLVNCYRRIGKPLEAIQSYEEALEYNRLYAKEKEMLFEQRQRQNITKLKLRADFEKSEDTRELLEQKTRELEETNTRLQEAMKRIQSLHGMLPICARCKKIRKDDGYWEQIEHYISMHSDATFSHSLCPECMRELYPDFCDETEEEI